MHRDLKAENLLLDANMNIKVIYYRVMQPYISNKLFPKGKIDFKETQKGSKILKMVVNGENHEIFAQMCGREDEL